MFLTIQYIDEIIPYEFILRFVLRNNYFIHKIRYYLIYKKFNTFRSLFYLIITILRIFIGIQRRMFSNINGK
jgi:hypothetical protein